MSKQAHDMYEYIDSLPNFSPQANLKKHLLFLTCFPEIEALSEDEGQLLKDNSRLMNIDHASILYKGQAYFHCPFSDTVDLHESLNVRMDQWITRYKTLRQYMAKIANYFTAVILHSKNQYDALALLPTCLHKHYLENGIIIPVVFAKCWLPQPTLTPEQIAAFHNTHAGVMSQIKTYQLNKLTQ